MRRCLGPGTGLVGVDEVGQLLGRSHMDPVVRIIVELHGDLAVGINPRSCNTSIASCALDIVHPIFWFGLNGGFVGGGGGGEGQRDWFPPPLPPDRPTPPSIAGEGKPRTERVLSSRRF